MVYFAYDLFLLCGVLLYSPFYLKRIRRCGEYRPDLLQRIGLNPPKPLSKKGKRIMIHSVSVGETRAVMPVIKGLRHIYPDLEIVVTTTTGTGRQIAEQMRGLLKDIYYFPLDFAPVCADFLKRVRPDLICLTETEIWPNFIRVASRYNIPICLINGRISDRSYKTYAIFKGFIKPLLGRFDSLCMQSAADAQRIMALGAPGDRVEITGNIKFDFGGIPLEGDEINRFREIAGLCPGQNVIVAGSTHPGEEATIIESFIRLLPAYPDLLLIIAPRHVERAGEIRQMIKAYGIKCRDWSKSERGTVYKAGEILLVDIIGILAKIYSLASIVFIGGSLVPRGGQNPIEPAFYGKPILFGPHMENFRSISSMLLDNGAALEVNSRNIFQRMLELLNDSARRDCMGKAARGVIQSNSGAAKYTCDKIISLLKCRGLL